MKKIILLCGLLTFNVQASEKFSDAEKNFSLVMKTLLEKHVDSNVSKEDLYRAATAGMLASLNKNDKDWNKLLSPTEVKNLQDDLSGKVSGIGVVVKFDANDKFPIILDALRGSAAQKAGLKKGDQILSVDGKRFTPDHFRELVNAIRGETGKTVSLKILRDEDASLVKVKREVVPFEPVAFKPIDHKTALIKIGYFTEQAPTLVADALKKFNNGGFKFLILDLRGNGGGGFESAIKTSGLFIPKGGLIATAKNREGKITEYKSDGQLYKQGTSLYILADKDTSSGAELFVAAVSEIQNAKVIGTRTFGKWNAQRVENLSNKFAFKYTTQEFFSPKGNSYEDRGLVPDVEIELEKGLESKELDGEENLSKRLEKDRQLKTALQLIAT